jgi:adenylate kinase
VSLRVVVVGVPGVGKTTVVDKVVAALPKAKLVTFGTVMFEEAKARRWAKDRDQMRKMPVEKQKRLQKLAASKIARMKDPVVLVDTHLFIRTSEGLWPGLPFEVVRAMKPTHLVLVEALPEEILKRRAADSTRSRDSLTTDGMVAELELGRSFLSVSATLTGAPMLIVTNREGRAEEVAESIASMLRSVAR